MTHPAENDSPMGRLLAEPTRCRAFAPDVAIHWYPSNAATCFCGAATRPTSPVEAHDFTEDIEDGSMCVCGVPALTHDSVIPPASPDRPSAKEQP